MLTIAGRTVGSRRPLFDDWSVPLDPAWDEGGEPTLRDLIERLVRIEVADYERRRSARRLDRVLSAGQIEAGEAAGRIAPEGRGRPAAPVDVEQAVGAALQAFDDGLYLVVIDGVERRDLDAPVRLGPDSRITFVRLVFLAGA
jgi:hypothetical protein